MLHLLDYFGFTGTGRWYNFWSGFGSDIGELAIVAALYRHVNCSTKGCWRLGHHINGTIVCHKCRKGMTHAV